MAESRLEFGVRLGDGTVWPRDSRDAAVASLRSIQHRGGNGTLVERTVTVTDWTDTEEA